MPPRGRFDAILRLRCPVCLDGPMFSGLFTMNPQCPVCGHRFEREPGYFRGAMYVSYAAGVVLLYVLASLVIGIAGQRIGWPAAFASAALVHLCLVIPLFRYSRVIWAHMNIGTEKRP